MCLLRLNFSIIDHKLVYDFCHIFIENKTIPLYQKSSVKRFLFIFEPPECDYGFFRNVIYIYFYCYILDTPLVTFSSNPFRSTELKFSMHCCILSRTICFFGKISIQFSASPNGLSCLFFYIFDISTDSSNKVSGLKFCLWIKQVLKRCLLGVLLESALFK